MREARKAAASSGQSQYEKEAFMRRKQAIQEQEEAERLKELAKLEKVNPKYRDVYVKLQKNKGTKKKAGEIDLAEDEQDT
jgi:hypothetical protein